MLAFMLSKLLPLPPGEGWGEGNAPLQNLRPQFRKHLPDLVEQIVPVATTESMHIGTVPSLRAVVDDVCRRETFDALNPTEIIRVEEQRERQPIASAAIDRDAVRCRPI